MERIFRRETVNYYMHKHFQKVKSFFVRVTSRVTRFKPMTLHTTWYQHIIRVKYDLANSVKHQGNTKIIKINATLVENPSRPTAFRLELQSQDYFSIFSSDSVTGKFHTLESVVWISNWYLICDKTERDMKTFLFTNLIHKHAFFN